jgi:TetR/AcrR family transcriptional repressor of mexJK operon
MAKTPTSNHDDPPARGRGRPVDPTLRERIISAARRTFLDHGLHDASLERIAAAAGTTRVTLYRHFPSKEALIEATLSQPVTAAFRLQMEAVAGRPPREALLQMGRQYLDLILGPQVIAQVHALYASANREPSVATSFYDNGPGQVSRDLKVYLDALVQRRVVTLDDTSIATEQLLALFRGNEQMRAMLALPAKRSKAARDRYLRSCVDLFLRGCEPSRSGKGAA